jgi:hypothetical protein
VERVDAGGGGSGRGGLGRHALLASRSVPGLVGVRRRGLFCVQGGALEDRVVPSPMEDAGESVAPRKSPGDSPALAISRSNTSPTKKHPGDANSSVGTRCPSEDANSAKNFSDQGFHGSENDSPSRYSKTPLNENLTVAPRTEATLEEGSGWNPDLTSELEPSQGMRRRRAIPVGASRGFIPDWASSGSIEDGLREKKRRARRRVNSAWR